jgi:hypothetical protein
MSRQRRLRVALSRQQQERNAALVQHGRMRQPREAAPVSAPAESGAGSDRYGDWLRKKAEGLLRLVVWPYYLRCDVQRDRALRIQVSEAMMSEKTFWESFKAESQGLMDKLTALVHEGNVRRVVVRHEGRTVAEFPLTAGVVGAVLAPVVAAIGAIVALLKDCTIHVERVNAATTQPSEQRRAAGE